jgi:hypothetical protein
MEASGDKAVTGGGGAAAAGSAGTWDNSVGVEHEANRKPGTKAERIRIEAGTVSPL